MGRRYFWLYDKVCHPLNLWAAYKNAARGKRYKPAAAAFEYDLEENLIEIERELQSETYARSVHRNQGAPTISHDFVGFRCASSER